MLKNLVINNIALIDHVDISFEEGLTALSGETGSGKSIIIDSLSFVLGERADKTLIKHGADFAEVTALFWVDEDSQVADKLEEYGYGRDSEVLISRKMSVLGKNEIRIQGRTATLSILKDICAELVDIFGQGQHLALLDEKKQLAALDSFCNFNGEDVLLRQAAVELSDVDRQLKAFGGSDSERERLIDILKYQIDELTVAELDEKEEIELVALRKRMMNAERLSVALRQTVELLNGDNSATTLLGEAREQLRSIAKIDEAVCEQEKRLEGVLIEASDVADMVEQMLSAVDFSPSEVDRVEERLDEIKNLKRKYGGTIADALRFLEDAQRQLAELSNSTERIAELKAQRTEVLKRMFAHACAKTAERKHTAELLSKQILAELAELGMKGTDFQIEFTSVSDFEDYAASPSANGLDDVRFLMSANVGEPLKPLSKVISGGEMSRFMLAVKNITAQAEKIPTMVFDEIDTGISGLMAQKVAAKLSNVSRDRQNGYQCIVITHLPQLAAMADVNLYIEKLQNNGRTQTCVKALADKKAKAAEVARLMGSVGEHAEVSANELIEWCDGYKKDFSHR